MAREQVTGLVVRAEGAEWTVLRGGSGSDRLSVADSGRADFEAPEGAGEPAPGEERSVFPSHLGAALKESYTGPRKNVSVCLPTGHVLLRVMSLPSEDDAELAGMVQLQVDKYSPFPVENMVVSHEVLRRSGTTSLVAVAAAERRVVDLLGKALNEAGIEPVRVDVSILARWRLMSDAASAEARGRQVVLLLDGPTPELLVTQDGTPLIMRAVDVAPGADVEAAAAAIVAEVTFTLMSLEVEHGSMPVTLVSVWQRDREPLALAVAGLLEGECGCGSQVASLADLPPVCEGVARRTLDEQGGELDLTPLPWRESEAARLFKGRMIMTACVVLGAWALLSGGGLGAMKVQESRLAKLRTRNQVIRQAAMDVRELRDRVFTLRRYMVRTHSVLECLREISMRQPLGVDLTSFSYRKGEGVKIQGMADSVDVVYAFKKNLDESTLFVGSNLNGPQQDRRLNKWLFDVDIRLPGDEE
jgi:Tfp pilus assembly protein PilN